MHLYPQSLNAQQGQVHVTLYDQICHAKIAVELKPPQYPRHYSRGGGLNTSSVTFSRGIQKKSVIFTLNGELLGSSGNRTDNIVQFIKK